MQQLNQTRAAETDDPAAWRHPAEAAVRRPLFAPNGGGAREAFLDHLYAALQERAERRERGRDRRLLQRGPDDRRTPALTDPRSEGHALRYLFVVCATTMLVLGVLATIGYQLAPQLYSRSYLAWVGEELAAGNNFGFFDLNIDMRELRRQHIKRLPSTPDVVVLGASHWQEAHAGLVPDRDFYNAHVHRDYYEDLLGVVEVLIRHDRLPETLVLSIRDMTFAPVEVRTDALWLTTMVDYRAMAARLGIRSHSRLETGELKRWLGLLSLSTTWSNAVRWLNAEAFPGPTREVAAATLDVVSVDGSIRWSRIRNEQFTPARTEREVRAALAERLPRPPVIDPTAVDAVDRLLGLLAERGVRLVLAHPPFNPSFYHQVQGTAYGSGLLRVQALTEQLARKHGAVVVGSFDPAKVGCAADMYIDSEHSNPVCLKLVLDQIPDL